MVIDYSSSTRGSVRVYFCLIILSDLINLRESKIALKNVYHDYKSQYYLLLQFLSKYFPSYKKEEIFIPFHSHRNIILLLYFSSIKVQIFTYNYLLRHIHITYWYYTILIRGDVILILCVSHRRVLYHHCHPRQHQVHHRQ